MLNKDDRDGLMEGEDIYGDEDEAWGEWIRSQWIKDDSSQESKKSIGLDYSYFKSLKIPGVSEYDVCVKKIGEDEITGYLTLWGDPSNTDIEAEYFTRDTDFWDSILGKSAKPLTWNHAQDKSFNADVKVGKIVDWGDDDVGRWYIATLDRSHKYRKAIEKLINDGKLGTSSDSAPQYVERIKYGKSTWLKSWPLFAGALTDTPAEPRMVGTVEYFKSFGISIPDSSERNWNWNVNKIKKLKLE